MEEIKSQEAQPMELEAQAVVYLNETRKWSIFLAILGFISIGLMILIGLFYGFMISALPMPAGVGVITGVVMIVMSALYFFPTLYLYKFSVLSKKAILENNKEHLTVAFRYLKSCFKFIGIVSIVVLSLYVLIFLVAIISGFMAGFSNAF